MLVYLLVLALLLVAALWVWFKIEDLDRPFDPIGHAPYDQDLEAHDLHVRIDR